MCRGPKLYGMLVLYTTQDSWKNGCKYNMSELNWSCNVIVPLVGYERILLIAGYDSTLPVLW